MSLNEEELKKIAKRLELINIAITLNEKDIISSQIKKLRSFGLGEEAKYIISLLEREAYDKASNKIKNYLRNLSDMNAYKDSKLQELQVQLNTLESDFHNLLETKNECIRGINEFNTLFHINLGDTINEILRAQLKNAQNAYKEGRISQDVFESIKERYEVFLKSRQAQEDEKTYDLDVKEKNKLKKLYKKANREINPDILLEQFKKRTSKMYSALNMAYLKQDLATIEKIQKTIDENPKSVYGYDKIDNKQAIREQSKRLREKIQDLKQDIDTLEQSEIYSLLHSINNLEEYFINIKRYLIAQKNELIKKIS